MDSFGLGINLVFFSLYTFYITPEEFSLYALAILPANFLISILISPYNVSILREKRISINIFDLKFMLGSLAAYIVSFTIFVPIFNSYDNGIKVIVFSGVLAIWLVMKCASTIFESFFQIESLYTRIAEIRFSGFVVQGVFTITFLQLELGAFSLVLGLIFSEIFRLLMLAKSVCFDFNFSEKNSKYFAALLKANILFSMLNYFARNADTLLVGYFYGGQSLGLYNRAYQLMQMPIKIISSISNYVMLPHFMERSDGNNDSAKNSDSSLYFLVSFLSFIFFLLINAYSKTVIDTFWGSEWAVVSDYLSILVGAMLPQSIISLRSSRVIGAYKEHGLYRLGLLQLLYLPSFLFGIYLDIESMILAYVITASVIVFPAYLYFIDFKLLSLEIRELFMVGAVVILLSSLQIYIIQILE